MPLDVDEEMARPAAPPLTRIVTETPYVTILAFLHTETRDRQDAVTGAVTEAARRLSHASGAIALNVLRSTDGSRVMTYQQWTSRDAAVTAEQRSGIDELVREAQAHLVGDSTSRVYRVVYADDRSLEGVTVITPTYTGAIFINEITTEPATQGRLLELVIANNEIQSQHTPGYRSANFHRSTDGLRAVNYSLWDTQEQCIEAISAMADMDENLDETAAIANPDFRFYTLGHAWHA